MIEVMKPQNFFCYIKVICFATFCNIKVLTRISMLLFDWHQNKNMFWNQENMEKNYQNQNVWNIYSSTIPLESGKDSVTGVFTV